MKFDKLPLVVFLFVTTLVGAPVANGQLSGSRGGSSAASHRTRLVQLSAEVARSYIAFDGVAEVRVQPTEIRVVLALTAEGETSAECSQQIRKQISVLRPNWIAFGIDGNDIVEDFIAVLPQYQFEIKKLGGVEIAVEKKVGYLMQTNIHLAVKDDAQAMLALDVAFENGVTDIIGFDYWSSDLGQKKSEARALALKAAREKSSAMMDELFETPPHVINVQEETTVHFPESLYVSYENSAGDEFRSNVHRNRKLPEIRLHRPKNTYYRGLFPNADVQSSTLPMSPEISVVSTVRLYFQSPATQTDGTADSDN